MAWNYVVADRISELVDVRGLTVADLAGALNVSHARARALYRNRATYTLTEVENVAKLLGIDIAMMLGDPTS